MRKKRYKAAIIGCGLIGGGYDPEPNVNWSATHAGAYKLCSEVELVAVADKDKKILKDFGQKWGVKRLYTDYKKLLENEEVDILSICLPTELHYASFMAACSYGIKAFFLEKPITYDYKDALKMVQETRSRIVAVNYFRRWNLSLRKLKDEIQDGKYGRVRKINVYYTKGIINNGSHAVDLLRWFIGEPIRGRALSNFSSYAKDYPIDFYLDFKDSVRAYFINVKGNYNVFEIDFLTDESRIIIGQRGQEVLYFRCCLEPYYKKFNILRLNKTAQTHWRDCMKRAVRDILTCLRYGGKPACTIEDGLRDLEICQAILKSSRKNRLLNFKGGLSV